MTAILIDMRDIQGVCRSCGTNRYTARELNAVKGQNWRCYRCVDADREGGPIGIPPGRHER